MRIAAAQGRSENSSIAGRYIHPDCGSLANGTPAIGWGSHAGTRPVESASPREQ
jgi:hypothetical protein